MAIAEVILICSRCGCTFKHRHECANRAAADEYQKWAVNKIDTCPACYKVEQSEKKSDEMDNVLADIRLVQLTGTEKQVAWAERIRKEAVYYTILEHPKADPAKFIAKVNEKTSAKWWIENHQDVECGGRVFLEVLKTK